MTQETDVAAHIHLKRAVQLIGEVENALDEFRKRALDHDTLLDNLENTEGFGGWLAGMATGMKSRGQLRRDKSALEADLQLASEELDRAEALVSDVRLETERGNVGILHFRAAIFFYRGQTEMVWGSAGAAQSHFERSLSIQEAPDSHYMLGLLHESEYKPKDALKHFERCLELQPDGELSVPALREAQAMRNYKASSGFRVAPGMRRFDAQSLSCPLFQGIFDRIWRGRSPRASGSERVVAVDHDGRRISAVSAGSGGLGGAFACWAA